ncbi:hypothetical protein GGR56DRAFT_695585 [Xylariaceae sp. FL0804]|nr:hypothetical protein GGR56DRAFT_695585 [Xylariaceae sp. FL0804]
MASGTANGPGGRSACASGRATPTIARDNLPAAAAAALPLVLSLKTVGLQVKVIEALNVTSQCRNILVYTPPDVTYSPTSAEVTTLTTFVKNGGNLIFMSKVPTALQSLAGVSASTVQTSSSRSVLQLSSEASDAAALEGIDFDLHYDTFVPFFNNYTGLGLNNIGYTAVNGSQTLGSYLVRTFETNVNGTDSADTSATSAAFVRNQPAGSTGNVYSFGLDLGLLYISGQNEHGNYAPWYDGHYYPGYDVGTRIIKSIVTSSAHFASFWTVPYNKGLAFTTTWDIDTYVSYPHGQGMAAAAQDRGAAGNLNLHVKYVTDAYERAYLQYGVPYMYQISGFRIAPDGNPYISFGSHTVTHSPNAVEFPYGTLDERYVLGGEGGYHPAIHECDDTLEYGTPDNGETCIKGGTSGLAFWTANATISGEVRVSSFLIRHLFLDQFGTDYNLSTYRPGDLAWNQHQASMCVVNGIIGGSSCAGNDHITHLPFQVTHRRESFQELPYYEFPLQWSDGDGNMSSADFPGSDFRNQVTYIEQMARYGGHYNILIHPSDALFDKIQIQRALHDAVRDYAVFFNQTGIANWWMNRDHASVDITAANNGSSTLTVKLEGRVEGLTLQVPRTYAFQSATGGLSVCQQISYDNATNAVVLRNTGAGTFKLNFNVKASPVTMVNCPDFTPQPAEECVAWDVAIDDFLEPWFYNNGVNLLLLETSSTGLSYTNLDGRLQLSASTNTGVNSYYTEISRFCFEASLYTHLFFDMVAPTGSSFYVQLVAYDDSCTNEASSATYLDVRDYAAADGTNHTVTIPLSDFQGVDMSHVRGIRIGNIAPAHTPIYIDNLKIQKRCVTAPGEDGTSGLTIESFSNVDRWITGINNIFGSTDYNHSMTFGKLSELGRMQLLPKDSESFFYTDVAIQGVNLNATAYTALELNGRGPSGGSFDVVVASGSGDDESTVNTASYASLSQSEFSDITIPLSDFSGLDSSSMSRITLRNFTPNGGSSASNFTMRYISLLGGPSNVTETSQCVRETGYVVLDFCDTTEFTTQTNALGASISDDNTMTTYTQTSAGSINLVPADAGSYFYSLFTQPTGCATVNSTYDSIVLTVSGPAGSTAYVGFKHGNPTCTTNVMTSYVPITFTEASAAVAIPFSRFPSGFNQNNLQSFVMTNFSSPGSEYHIYSLTFTGASDEAGCGLCSGTLLNTCTFDSDVPRTNQLLGLITDESTLTSYTANEDDDGSLYLGTNEDAYWYSQFGANACYDSAMVSAAGIQLSVSAPADTDFDVQLRWKTDSNCTVVSDPATVAISDYVTFTSNTSYEVATIPFTAFTGLNASTLGSVALSHFTPDGVDVKVGCISLVSSVADSAASAALCAASGCPDDAWLSSCYASTASRNAIGGVQSDDGTMAVTPSLSGGALQLQPAATSSSYWYSLLGCLDASAASTLYLNVSAAAGATFDVQLQSSGNTCADSSQLTKATVSSSAYGALTGGSTLLEIPLADFSGVATSELYAAVLQNFSGANGTTYSLNCAYFGNATVSDE